MVVQWLALSHHRHRTPGLNPSYSLSVKRLHVLAVPFRVPHEHSGLLPKTYHHQVCSTADFEVTVDVTWSWSFGPMLDWEPVHGGTLSLLISAGIGFSVSQPFINEAVRRTDGFHSCRAGSFFSQQSHDADHLHYAAVNLSNKRSRPRGQRDFKERDTVYSGVRQTDSM